jgi:hypothetical protein
VTAFVTAGEALAVEIGAGEGFGGGAITAGGGTASTTTLPLIAFFWRFPMVWRASRVALARADL